MSEHIGNAWRELIYATRSLRRDPALAIGVILTLGLAIGANAAMFGLVTRLMLPAPPGIADPARVSRIALNLITDEAEQYTSSTTSYPIYQALAERTESFSAVAAVRSGTHTVGRGADAIRVDAIEATGQYFTVLGARPALGRFFTPADDELPAGNTVVVLAHSFWKRQFGGAMDIIGKQVVFDDATFTVIGVAAPDFSGDALAPVDLFVPFTTASRARPAGWWSDLGINLISIVARLRDGVSPAAASAAAGRNLPLRDGLIGVTVVLESLLPAATRSSAQARVALWSFGVAIVVLLIATANVGTLLLLRALRRRREIAVRMALGAGRLRLAGQLTAESLLLAIVGGMAGLLVSRWLADIVRATLLPNLAATDRFVDGRVLAATIVFALGAGLLAGVVPLVLLSHERLAAELHGSGILGSAGRSRAQRMLVGIQVALCTLLLVGAGLSVRSLDRVQSQELGISISRLLFVTLDFRTRLPVAEQDEAHFAAVRRLERTSGVTGATVVQAMPFGSFHVPPISVPGMAEPPMAGGQLPFMYGATPAYLDMLGVTLVQGRLLTDADRLGSSLVVLVNETMAREVWPGQGAIGKCIRVGFDPDLPPAPLAPATLPCREVVGVVRDSRARSLRPVGREATQMQYYVPFAQLPATYQAGPAVFGILVRTAGDPERMLAPVQRALQDSPIPVSARVRPYQDLLDPQLRPWRLGATLFTAFGALALCIAAVGLFGVVSYLVAQRRREIGLRLALGGTGALIGRSVIGAALRMVGIGVAVGLGAALLIGSAAESMLFQTSGRDVVILAGAAIALLGVTVVAAAVPAWRAARVSPMAALRVD
jgi:predicted permease